jgi:hypothetical protein
MAYLLGYDEFLFCRERISPARAVLKSEIGVIASAEGIDRVIGLADFPVPGGPRTTKCCRASNATREARMTSSRSINDAANSRSMACSLSRDGLMDARLSVVVIAMILSLICLPLPSFCSACSAPRRGAAIRRRRPIFRSGVEVYRLAPPVLSL